MAEYSGQPGRPCGRSGAGRPFCVRPGARADRPAAAGRFPRPTQIAATRSARYGRCCCPRLRPPFPRSRTRPNTGPGHRWRRKHGPGLCIAERRPGRRHYTAGRRSAIRLGATATRRLARSRPRPLGPDPQRDGLCRRGQPRQRRHRTHRGPGLACQTHAPSRARAHCAGCVPGRGRHDRADAGRLPPDGRERHGARRKRCRGDRRRPRATGGAVRNRQSATRAGGQFARRRFRRGYHGPVTPDRTAGATRPFPTPFCSTTSAPTRCPRQPRKG